MYEIWGPATGSTLIEVEPLFDSRVRLTISTDFGKAGGVLNKEGVKKLQDALNEILKDME